MAHPLVRRVVGLGVFASPSRPASRVRAHNGKFRVSDMSAVGGRSWWRWCRTFVYPLPGGHSSANRIRPGHRYRISRRASCGLSGRPRCTSRTSQQISASPAAARLPADQVPVCGGALENRKTPGYRAALRLPRGGGVGARVPRLTVTLPCRPHPNLTLGARNLPVMSPPALGVHTVRPSFRAASTTPAIARASGITRIALLPAVRVTL